VRGLRREDRDSTRLLDVRKKQSILSPRSSHLDPQRNYLYYNPLRLYVTQITAFFYENIYVLMK